MREILFNPIFKQHKNPVGSNTNSDDIFITIHITKDYFIHSLRMILKDDSNKIIHHYELYKTSINEQYHAYTLTFRIEDAGLYWYYFEFDDTYGTHYIGSNSNLDAVLTDYSPISWQLGIHLPFKGTLDWYKGKVMYQIMVDRFYNDNNNYKRSDAIYHERWDELPNYQGIDGKIFNNDFFGGNLKGIIKKLEYLKSLNVGVIYLNPIFEAYSNHKYDTGDYMKIDPQFGSEEDFVELCKSAKELGISIILDGVFNHTGDDSIYFNRYNKYQELGAYQSKSSKYFQWYNFIEYPDEYSSWWGVKTLPSLNQNNQHVIDFIAGRFGVIDKWLSLGAKGFRLDVVDELNDNFLNQIYHCIKENRPNSSENIIIGEVWEDASDKIAYGKRRTYFNGRQLDSVMNYPLKNAIFDYLKHNNYLGLKHQVRHLINNYPKHVLDLLMNPLGTHDTIRLLNNFSLSSVDSLSKEEQATYVMKDEEYQNALVNLKLATIMQFTFPGIPSILYGDEAGMQGFKDPLCRHTLVWEKIDQEILIWYQTLGKIRSENDVYADGLYVEEFIENNIYAFSRCNSKTKIMTIVNNSLVNFTMSISSGYDLINNHSVEGKITVFRKQGTIIRFNI